MNSSSNWATNLMAMKRPHCPGSTAHVHAGYLRHWRHLQAAGLTRAVVDKAFAADRDSVLVVTGHSLGGAVAQIAALELTELIDREVIVYAYGAPRFGNVGCPCCARRIERGAGLFAMPRSTRRTSSAFGRHIELSTCRTRFPGFTNTFRSSC